MNISYKDHVTNEEVRRKIQAAIGEYDELLTLVKKRKLRWFGHVSRSSGLAKTILQGTVNRKRKRGRQKKRWEDNIKEWTGMDFASSTRAAENRTKWKGIVANSSVVPRRPSKVMGKNRIDRCPFFYLEFSKCNYSRALAPACGALVRLCHYIAIENPLLTRYLENHLS